MNFFKSKAHVSFFILRVGGYEHYKEQKKFSNKAKAIDKALPLLYNKGVRALPWHKSQSMIRR